ncbi:MAG: hypothetical protein QOJ51_2817, partial [Acidobacteriaceae bacterium]|nr:hypothetical protein [Acidobacteriaceae bacterium]
TTDDLAQTIGRADVPNLTSTQAGHNHPKLYGSCRLEGVE